MKTTTIPLSSASPIPSSPINNWWHIIKSHRRIVHLVINETYLISYAPAKITEAKFIRSTQKGYNFLDSETEKLIFKRHFYASKKQDWDGIITQTTINDIWIWMDNRINLASPKFSSQTKIYIE